MPRTLVTGAAGFTGMHLAPALRAAGHEVFDLDADLLDRERLAESLARTAPEFVVHLAAVSFVAATDVDTLYRTNIVGTRNLLDALARLPSSPRLVLLASSANVYGSPPIERITEDTPPSPANDYAVSKLAMEHVAALYAPRLPITIVRPFNYTGRGQAPHFLVPKIVAHALARAPGIELGNLDVARDFSDVRFVVECYRRLLERADEVRGRTFNVCSGRPHSLTDILHEVEELSGHRMKVRVNPAFVRANEIRSLAGDPTRLRDAIGDVPPIPLRETLRWMMLAPTEHRDS
jgi:nucleoside-diphosphate-sugar epimerase